MGGGSVNVCILFNNGILSGQVWIVPTHSAAYT